MSSNHIGSRIEETASRIEPELVAIRRDLHAHPELAFEEVRTAAIVAERLASLGIAHRTGVGRTGVLGTIDTGRPGPTLLLRADMDALPIHEQTGLDFASTVPGKMHACGHDLHTATLLGVAEVLAGIQPMLSGRIQLMFQPAEEVSDSGAAAMMRDGALEGVDMALGFHNYPGEPVGTFSFVPGVAGGSSDEFTITVTGRSGHAARPHLTSDPIVAAATLILQLQTIVSREMNPMRPIVLTIGVIQGGLAPNIIPDAVRIVGTVRTHHEEDRVAMEAAIARHCAGVSASLRVECALAMERGTPPLVSDAGVMAKTMKAIREHYGDEVVLEAAPSLGAEDFALIGERVPTFQLGVGSGMPGRHDELHNSDYQPDERSIRNGVVALSLAAVELLTAPVG
ncbi:M20 metallopeptidase family protein [Aureimonas pseudogalii]|uniref:Amidohydrolase n=1 Tax=Aureimonas pseudogalii TaxID=1744844 RepID=A0A7W6H2C7_9HYPH|nr:M20 family metallopeptidase [Aureimonas pseudogalii]MBB3996916.1 amidohydrolase [Aureimonas pseudogalii]